jgi:hypothetical protein
MGQCAGLRRENTTHRYTSDEMAKRWWPRRPLCVAVQGSLPAHGVGKRMIARYSPFHLYNVQIQMQLRRHGKAQLWQS